MNRKHFYAGASALIVSLIGGGFAFAQGEGDEQQDRDTITVTATRTEKAVIETPASVTVQSLDELRQKGFAYGTDEFRGVPGLFFRRGEGDGEEFPFVSIRGVTGNHGNDTFLALIDGIPFVGPDEEVLLYEVPYAAIEAVDIVRGPVSALYGRGAIAGAVNYRTRSPRENALSASFSGGSDDFYRAEALVEHRLSDDVGVLVSATYENFEGWRANSAREVLSVFGKTEVSVGPESTLTGYLSYTDRKAEVPSAIPTLADGTPVDVFGGVESFLGFGQPLNDNSGVIGALRLNHQITENADLQITLQGRRFNSDVALNFYDFFAFDPANSIFGVNGFRSPSRSRVLFGEAILNWELGRHTIVSGISAERATLDERDLWSGVNDPFFDGSCGFSFYSILIDYSTGQVVNDDPLDPCFRRDEVLTADKAVNAFFGAFIQDEIALTDRLSLTVGLRWDTFSRDAEFSVVSAAPVDPPQEIDGNADAFAPKAALSYDVGGGIVYASYGRGFNSNFGPLFQFDPGQFARVETPTTIDSIEVGWKGQAFGGVLEWETAAFYLKQKNRRIFVPNPDPAGPPTLATTGQRYSSRGVEASLRVRPSDRTTAVINYTYLDPEWNELIIAGSFGAPDEDFSGVTPQGVPANIVYGEVEHRFADWLTARATFEWYDDYFVDLSNSVKTGQFELLGLSATISPPGSDRVALDLSVTNLLDKDYFFFFAGSRTAATNASPGVPRQFRATLRARF
jgi:iron complex outermembrane receptor protein